MIGKKPEAAAEIQNSPKVLVAVVGHLKREERTRWKSPGASEMEVGSQEEEEEDDE